MEVENYLNMPEMLGLPCHYYSNEKVIIVTFNKGASRFLSNFFQKDLDAALHFDLDFNIIENSIDNHTFFHNNISNQEIVDEWENVKAKSSHKQVVFLYRDPYKRLLTGLVQEYYSAMLPSYTQSYPYSFILKKFLHKYDGGADTYDFIVTKKFDSLFVGQGENTVIDNWRIENTLINTFEDFLLDISQTPVTFMQHTNLYFIYLYDLVKSLNDCENVKIFNLDNGDISLKSLIQGFMDEEELERITMNVTHNSNKWFMEKIFTRIQNGETKHDFSIIFKLLVSSINPDLIAYSKLQRMKSNILPE